METITPMRKAERFGTWAKLSWGSATGCFNSVAYFHISMDRSMLRANATRNTSSAAMQQHRTTPTSRATLSTASWRRPRGSLFTAFLEERVVERRNRRAVGKDDE